MCNGQVPHRLVRFDTKPELTYDFLCQLSKLTIIDIAVARKITRKDVLFNAHRRNKLALLINDAYTRFK